MSDTRRPTPDRIMQIITGGWATAILGAAAQHGVFEALDPDGNDVAGVVQQTGISARGAVALLDGLTGLGLLVHSGERYHNTPEASMFLIRQRPAYLGAMGQVMTHALTDWARLPEVAGSGVPVAENTSDVPDNAFWHMLVTAIAAMSLPVAKMAAERLGLKQAGAARWLDVGGGSGVWSAAWLSENRAARAVQLDWPQVNAIARDYVGKFGVADRFQTIDADLHEADLGAAEYDYGIYGHIAHQETPVSNIAMFKKFRRAIKPGGTLLVNDFVLDDDRSGNPFAMMFAAQMLLVTQGGCTWRRCDYRAWLSDAGFSSVEFVPTPSPSTLMLAR